MISKLPSSLASLPVRAFAPGEILLHEGRDEGLLFFLDAGTVEVTKGGQAITRVHERGAMFGEMSVLLGCAHTATVTAVDRVECRVARDPAQFLTANPDVLFYVCRTLARRLDSLNRYLVDIKDQFADRADHLGMVDEVLGAIMNRHPREVPRPTDPGD